MPSPSDTKYSARLTLPHLIERGSTSTLRCPVYRDGALVAPSIGSYTIYDADNESYQTGATVQSGSIATATVTSPSTDELGQGWRVVWELVMPDAVTHKFRNDAAMVRHRLYCPITDADLFERYSSLDPNGGNPVTAKTTFQSSIDAAWVVCQRRLIERGNRPNLIVNAGALFEFMVELTMSYINDDLSQRMNPAYADMARRHRVEAESAWKRVQFLYADGDDETYDPHNTRGTSSGTWLM